MSDDQPNARPWPPQQTVVWLGQQPSSWPPATGPATLSPQDAKKSRRWRFILGISSLFLAAVAAFYSVMNFVALSKGTSSAAAYGGPAPQSAVVIAVVAIAVYTAGTLAYAGIGIWNILTRRTTAPAPLIAAMVLAGVVIVLVAISMAGSVSTGHTPQIGGLGLNALIIVRAAVVLRMKKAPTGARY